MRSFGSPPDQRRSRSSRRVLGLGAGLAFVLLTCTGCDTANLPRLAFPTPATEEGPRMLLMWQGSWLAAVITGGVVWGLIIWACLFHRKKSEDHVPIQSRYNLPIEVLYTVIPFIMISVLFYFTARDESVILDDKKTPDMTVNVVGRQWSWTFNYLLGQDAAYDVGAPGKHLPELWLPTDKHVRFILTSPDVIHSFWVPAFLFKMDVFPGRQNHFQLTPNKIGVYEGKCAELCGTDHSRMLFVVHVVSDADFKAHIAQLRANGQGGELQRGDQGLPADRAHAYTLHDENPASEADETTPGSKQ